MRELTSAERLDVNGGILPLVLAAAAAVVLGGCATQGAKVTCAPTSYHFLVESFDCIGLMRPSVASVDFGHIHVA